MVRAELIHDVLWITRTHESCPKDAAPNAGGKRTAAAAAGSSSSEQQQDELMEIGDIPGGLSVPRAHEGQFHVQHFDGDFSQRTSFEWCARLCFWGAFHF